MARVVRVYFKTAQDTFCIDRPFAENLSDQENCDHAIQAMIDSMKASTIVPALHLISLGDEQTKPVTEHVLMNLGKLFYVAITDVRVYEAAKVEEAK
jgi:hypothetical protein